VGCGQNVYVKDGKVVQIEGDPDSPVSRGRLCPKGSASSQLTMGGARQYQVRYRRPFGTDWEDLDLDTAMDMIADRVIAARRSGSANEASRPPDGFRQARGLNGLSGRRGRDRHQPPAERGVRGGLQPGNHEIGHRQAAGQAGDRA
jgi:formate dehydrogenase major subunit